MRKKRRRLPSNLVPHPRYGSAVIRSRSKLTEAEVRKAHWRYKHETLFPESAIVADTRKQHFSIYPRKCYVDILKTCRECDKPFLFFALEQKHWYEELGFYIDADCIHCPKCRRSDQTLRRRFRRYSERVGRTDLDDDTLAEFVRDALALWEAGILRDEQRLRRIRNVARRRIPERKETHAMNECVAQLDRDE